MHPVTNPQTRWLRTVSLADIRAELRRRSQRDRRLEAKRKRHQVNMARRFTDGGATLDQIAGELGVPWNAVRKMLIAQLGAQRYRQHARLHEQRARTSGRPGYVPWTAGELELLRRDYGRVPGAAIAAALGRNVWQIRAAGIRYGLSRKYHWNARGPEEIEAALRARNAEGWADTEIARELGVDRHAVSGLRRRLGLPSRMYSERVRRAVAAGVARQCERLGIENMGKLRVKVHRDRARAAGWPEDLRWRAVQILNALWDHGPMTRRQLAEAIGMPWKEGVHEGNLTGNGRGGTYTAALMRRGLVVCLGRVARATSFLGHPSTVAVYSLPLTIQRAQPMGPEQSNPA